MAHHGSSWHEGQRQWCSNSTKGDDKKHDLKFDEKREF